MASTSTGLRFAAAISDAPGTPAALDQVSDALAASLGEPADFVVAFATGHHRDQFDLIQRRLGKALSARIVLGVTAEGVIGSKREIERAPGLSVIAARLPGASLHPFSYQQIDWSSPTAAGAALPEKINPEGKPLRAILLLADPFSTPMPRLLSLLQSGFAGVPVVGGMASAAREPGDNRLIVNDQVLAEGAIGLSIAGDVRVDCIVSQGCRPIGKPVVITKSQRNVVMELAGQNAWQFVQAMGESLPEEDRERINQGGLFVGRVINEYKDRFGRGDFLIRGLLGVNPEHGYLGIADAQARVGQTIQFHVRDDKTATEDFELLLEGQKLHGDAAGAMLFSCNGRGTRLFDHPNADATMVHDALGDLPLAGFFAAGEIGPVGGENFVHGHTASLAVFRTAGA